jgi:hypothetical protein
MTRFWKALVLLQFQLAFAQNAHTTLSSSQAYEASSHGAAQITAWISPKIQHAYGLPEAKPKEKGKLTVNPDGLTFTGKPSLYTIPWRTITAMSTGTERVEMWGTTGRIVRMAIPNGGGLAAAGVMHHKVNELTVEFHDPRDAYHAAVFYVPGNDAARVLETYTQISVKHADTGGPLPPALAETPAVTCQNSPGIPRSVLVAAPDWNQAEVPAAYRAFVYEHIVDRLQRTDKVGHVYRAGELDNQHACPQYTVRISIMSFKPGNQVERATMGPIGFFAGTTQMAFNVTITDASGKLDVAEQVKATVRGESESKNVADGVAKNLAKRYAAALKQFEKTKTMAGPASSRPRQIIGA